MEPLRAFRFGYLASAAGFYFDGMEIIAAVSTQVGGFDEMGHALELILAENALANEAMTELSDTVGTLLRRNAETPTGVDQYRRLLENGVFEVVNAWSRLDDASIVRRRTAWFYAGFGIGRARTVALGAQLLARLREMIGESPYIAQMPDRLGRLAVEAARHLDSALHAGELEQGHALVEDAAARSKELALSFAVPLDEWSTSQRYSEHAEALTECYRAICSLRAASGADR